MVRSYIQDQRIYNGLQKLKTNKNSYNGVVWGHIVDFEFSGSAFWFTTAERFIADSSDDGENVIWSTHYCNRWYTCPGFVASKAHLLVICMRHDGLPGRHTKFEDEAREAVLLVLTCSPSECIEQDLVVAAASEFMVCFYEWSGWNSSPTSRLNKMSFRNPVTGEIHCGPLHIEDNADVVDQLLKDIMKESESAASTTAVYLANQYQD